MAKQGIGKAIFLVRVEYLRDNTWQGVARWMDTGREQRFRSTLELVKLIDEALEAGAVMETRFSGWDEVPEQTEKEREQG